MATIISTESVTYTKPIGVELVVRRPDGSTETVDASAKFPHGLTDSIFAQVQAATRKAGRGEVLSYQNKVAEVVDEIKFTDADAASEHSDAVERMRSRGF